MSLDVSAGSRRHWAIYLALGAIAVGIFFRFYHIDRKVYWDDEIYTSLRVLGFTEAEWVERSNRIVDADGLRALLHPARSQPPRSIANTIGGLIAEEPQHGPIYYAAAHYWVRLFGDSTAALRSLSVVFGILALPAAYWLCFELFGTATAASIGVTLFAFAPVFVLYSQEAREYSLWEFSILLMGAAFLRGLRLQTLAGWVLYAAAFVFALYVDPLSGLIALGQGVYLVALFRTSPRALVLPLAAIATGALCFLPWLLMMLTHAEQIHRAWATIATQEASWPQIGRYFLEDLRLNFADFNVVGSAWRNALLTLPAVGLIAYALSFLCRRASLRVWAYVVTTIVCTAGPLVFADMFLGGARTENARYFMPLYVGVDLAVAYLIFAKILGTRSPSRGARAWAAVFAAIIAFRLGSCLASSQADTWWNKLNQKSIEVARAIDAAPRPLLVSDNYIGWAVSLGNYLDPKVRVELRPRCYLCRGGDPGDVPLEDIALGHYTVFLLGPSQLLQARVKGIASVPDSGIAYRCIDVRSNCSSTLALW